MAVRQRIAAVLRGLAVAGLTAVAVLRVRDALKFLSDGIAVIRYPFGLDYGEGALLNQVQQLAAGHSIYHSVDQPPYTVSNYPPVFQLITALLDACVHDTLAAGRALSVASTLLMVVVIGMVVWRALPMDLGLIRRGLAALIGGLGVLSIWYTQRWAPLMRIDMLAGLFAWIGVLLFVAGAGQRRYWCAVPFLLALYTKHTALAAPAACLIVALVVDRRYAVRLAAIILGTGLGLFLAIDALTAGTFHFLLIKANNNAFSWAQAFSYLLDIKANYPVELAIAVVGAVSLLRQHVTGNSNVSRRAANWNWARPVLGVFLFTAFLVSLTVGKIGAYVNYLIEFTGVMWACVAVMVGDACAEAERTQAIVPRVVAALLPVLLLVPMSSGAASPDRLVVPDTRQRDAMQELLEMVRRTDGPVLSQDMTLLVLAGKPVEFQPVDMTNLANQREWDENGIVRPIEQRRYRLVILDFDVAAPPDSVYLSPRIVGAIRDQYRLLARMASYWVYAPA